MRRTLSRRKATALMVGALSLMLLSSGRAQNLYGEDLSARLASPQEIREVTTIRSRLRKVSKVAEPLFVLTPPPFAEIDAAPDTLVRSSKRPKQWSLPPWPSLDPALPDEIPEEVRAQLEARRQASATADIWPEVEVPGQERDKPSALLVPRRVDPSEEVVFRVKELPPPFSVRRYYESDQNIFVELAAYGGTSWSRAEEAYRAIKEAAVQQEPMQGFGEDAFLTRVEVIDPSTIPPPETADAALPEAPPFEEIAPGAPAQPELLDSGAALALTAPAFREVPVADLEGRRVSFPSEPKKYYPKNGVVKQTLMVLVAYYPDESLTLTFALEERLGTPQDLMAIALLAQKKLREIVLARD